LAIRRGGVSVSGEGGGGLFMGDNLDKSFEGEKGEDDGEGVLFRDGTRRRRMGVRLENGGESETSEFGGTWGSTAESREGVTNRGPKASRGRGGNGGEETGEAATFGERGLRGERMARA